MDDPNIQVGNGGSSSTTGGGRVDVKVETRTESKAPVKSRASTGIVRRACAECGRRKSKCSGDGPPCGACLKRGSQCEYLAQKKRGRKVRSEREAIAAAAAAAAAEAATASTGPGGQGPSSAGGNTGLATGQSNASALLDLADPVSRDSTVSRDGNRPAITAVQALEATGWTSASGSHHHQQQHHNGDTIAHARAATYYQDTRYTSHHIRDPSRQQQHQQQQHYPLPSPAYPRSHYNHQQPVTGEHFFPRDFGGSGGGHASTSRVRIDDTPSSINDDHRSLASQGGHPYEGVQCASSAGQQHSGSPTAKLPESTNQFFEAERPDISAFYPLARPGIASELSPPTGAATTSSTGEEYLRMTPATYKSPSGQGGTAGPGDKPSKYSRTKTNPNLATLKQSESGNDAEFPPTFADYMLTYNNRNEANIEEDFVYVESEDTEDLLYRVYWSVCYCLWPLLYRPAQDMYKIKQTKPLLHHAILGIACARNLQPGEGSPDLVYLTKYSQYHALQFKEEFDIYNTPKDLSTIQALLLMAFRGMHESDHGLAWLYMGLATRWALEMKLHDARTFFESTSFTPSKHSIQEETSRVIWCLYIADQYMSLTLGRPTMLSKHDIATPLPSVSESDEYALWGTDTFRFTQDTALKPLGDTRSHVMTHLHVWINLTMIMEDIVTQIYQRKNPDQAQRRKHLIAIDEALAQWEASYPPALGKFQEASAAVLPHFLLIRMWYHTCLIMLHRPFIPQTIIFRRPNRTVTSYTICTEAAEAINALIKHYFETIASDIGVSNTVLFILLQAGIMHVVNSASNDEDTRQQGRKHFEECLDNLRIVSKFRSTGVHYIKILRHLDEVNGKRDNAPISTEIIERSRMISRPGSPISNYEDPFLGSAIQPDIEVQAQEAQAQDVTQPSSSSAFENNGGSASGTSTGGAPGQGQALHLSHLQGQNEYWSTMPLAGFDLTEWENWESFASQYNSLFS